MEQDETATRLLADASNRPKLHFIPTAPGGAVRLLSEACCMAIMGTPSWDADVWVASDGEVKVTLPGISTDEEAQARVSALVQGYAKLQEALRKSAIFAMVESRETGTFYRIDRFYWLHNSLTEGDDLRQCFCSVPDHLLGQPIVMDESTAPHWRDIVGQALPRDGGNEPGRSNSGPDALKGKLPPSAKANDLRHEDFAHAAARLLRQDRKKKLSEAIREVAPEDAMRTPPAVERAIRSAFDLMYNDRGMPHQN